MQNTLKSYFLGAAADPWQKPAEAELPRERVRLSRQGGLAEYPALIAPKVSQGQN